jgi:hypothetical protein
VQRHQQWMAERKEPASNRQMKAEQELDFDAQKASN